MRKVLKWIALLFGSLLGLVIIVSLALLVYANLQFKPFTQDRPLAPITAHTSWKLCLPTPIMP